MPSKRFAAGFTLLEALVTLAIGALTMVAGIAFLGGVQWHYRTQVEGADANRRAMFATTMLHRAVRMAGYRNWNAGEGVVLPPERDAWAPMRLRASCAGSADACRVAPGLSALLEVRHHGAGAGPGDGSVLDCAGRRVAGPRGPNDVSRSAFYVARADDGVPALFCKYADETGAYRAQALVEGVEAMYLRFRVRSDTHAVPGGYAREAGDGAGDVTRRWRPASEWSEAAAAQTDAVAVALVLRGGAMPGAMMPMTSSITVFDAERGGAQVVRIRQQRPHRLRVFHSVVERQNGRDRRNDSPAPQMRSGT
jgi:type IV pilus assembly protein PilW